MNDYDELHRDSALIALDKPSGLLAVPGRGPDKADCLAVRVQRWHPAAKVVHRLDRDTSGVMVMALTRQAERSLARQFQTRRVAKRYVAVVAGRVADDAGRIDLPLRKDMTRRYVHLVDHRQGKPAVTDYRVIDRLADRTRLELTPITGRSHQLRVHLRAIGHPILGDPLYGDAASAARLMLHAERLELTHPTTGEATAFAAPRPF